MKKFVKRVTAWLLSFVICMMMCTLTACTTTLKGTYTTKDELIKQSFTFKEDNKVDVSAFGISVEGEYLIEDNEIIITYSIGPLSYDLVKSFKKDGNSIFIDGTEFIKDK